MSGARTRIFFAHYHDGDDPVLYHTVADRIWAGRIITVLGREASCCVGHDEEIAAIGPIVPIRSTVARPVCAREKVALLGNADGEDDGKNQIHYADEGEKLAATERSEPKLGKVPGECENPLRRPRYHAQVSLPSELLHRENSSIPCTTPSSGLARTRGHGEWHRKYHLTHERCCRDLGRGSPSSPLGHGR